MSGIYHSQALTYQVSMKDEKENLNQWVCLSKTFSFGSISFHREVMFFL